MHISGRPLWAGAPPRLYLAVHYGRARVPGYIWWPSILGGAPPPGYIWWPSIMGGAPPRLYMAVHYGRARLPGYIWPSIMVGRASQVTNTRQPVVFNCLILTGDCYRFIGNHGSLVTMVTGENVK
jgi:hypothetical protein